MRNTTVVMLLAVSLAFCAARASAEEKVLFDFEDAAQANAWVMWQAPKPEKGRAPEPEPEAKLAVEAGELVVTYTGGNFPTIVTTQVPEDLTPFETLKADVTVSRPMVMGFRIMQEKSEPGKSDTYWECTMFLRTGQNDVSFSLKKPQRFRTRLLTPDRGKVVSLMFHVYSPDDGEKVLVDNIRLATEDDPNADNKLTPNGRPKDGYKVLGTELVVKDVADLGQKLKDKWVKPEKDLTVEEREAAFKALHEELRKTHPKAVMVTLREGDTGCDVADPGKTYKGWESTYVNSHGPDGGLQGRASGQRDWGNLELFMRHRSQLMRVDVTGIPKGAKVLAARLLLVASMNRPVDKPNMFAAEACNRPWVEDEVNCYRYAKGKLWRWPSGQFYDGDDPDYLPLYLAYGPGEGKTNVWDFTEAVRFWTDGKHENHGFFLHGDAAFYARTFTKRCEELKNRPALVVIYEP